MPVRLPKHLWPTEGMTKKEKLLVMKERQAWLAHWVRQRLGHEGYTFGESLKLPGSFAFHAKTKDAELRVGIKTATDRWVGVPRQPNGEWGLLSAVDVVFVVTVSPVKNPKALQIYEFAPAAIIEKATKVYAKAAAVKQTGFQWIPLDHHEGRSGTSMAAGPLGPVGRLIVEEEIEWIEHEDDPRLSEANRQSTKDDDPDRGQPLTISEAKRRLALAFGVRPDAIEITIRG